MRWEPAHARSVAHERQGSYLTLFYALAATDFHHENIIASGERLLATAQLMAQGIGWGTAIMPQPLAGFSHGAAGMAWALWQLSTATGLGRFHTATYEAVAYERYLFAPTQGNWLDLRDSNVYAMRLIGVGASPQERPRARVWRPASAREHQAGCYSFRGGAEAVEVLSEE